MHKLEMPQGPHPAVLDQPYGDLTQLNTSRLILNSVGKDILSDIVRGELELLHSSSAVYERNGDYALGIFTSGWCRKLDAASRALCSTADNAEALACGTWHCHESCWNISKAAIDTGRPVDIPCLGGINIYAVPIRAGDEIIGAINFGHGDPPRDQRKLQELAERYGLSAEELASEANAHVTDAGFSLENAKKRLGTVARLIGKIVEHRRAEARLAAQNAVAQVLVESETLAEATPKLLRAVCETVGWDIGILWQINDQAAELRCVDVWHDPARSFPSFEAISRRSGFKRGVGLPGRIWSSGQLAWIPDVVPDDNFPRAPYALMDNLHGAFGFPIRHGRLTLGVIEFFSREVRQPDRRLLDLFGSIGSQIGQFILRKRGEDELKRAEEKYRSIFENAVEGIFQCTADGQYITVNPAMALILGYASAEELLSGAQNLVNQLHADPEKREEFARLIQERGAVVGFECTFRCKDGSTVWVSVNARALRDESGRIQRYEGTVENISKRKLAEEAMRHSQSMLEGMFEAAGDAIVVVDHDGRIVLVNDQTVKTFQFERHELLNQSVEILVPEQLRAEHVRLRTAYMDRPCMRPMGIGQGLSARRKDGREIPVQISLGPLETAGGKFVLSIIRDISKQRALEEQYRQAQKMEAVGRLAGGVAHDFNNLLTVINGYSEMALSGLRPGDPMHETIEQIRKAGEKAALLTRQLLAFSRKQVLQPTVMDLNDLLAEMEKMLGRLLGEDIDLQVRPAANLWRVKADAGQLEQVVMNLVVNARDAMPTGGKLTIETANVCLDESYVSMHSQSHAGEYVLVSVSDTGCGMTLDARSRIFEPFYTTKGPNKGTGLGLSTVLGIVQQSGGHIEVYSELGLGTTFKVYLPRNREKPLSGKSHPGTKIAPQGNETILLAEDEPGVRSLTRLVLVRLGYQVLEARNGVEALQTCEQYEGNIDLLITDVVMPNLSGREVAERLESLRPGMKVLFVSGYTDDAIVRHGVLHADTQFLQKPFTPDALAAKVREVLDQSSQGQRPEQA